MTRLLAEFEQGRHDIAVSELERQLTTGAFPVLVRLPHIRVFVAAGVVA